MEADGTLDLTGGPSSSATGSGRIQANTNVLFSAPLSYATGDPLDFYSSSSAPVNFFGSSATIVPGSNFSGGAANVIGVNDSGVLVHFTYVSNTLLSSSMDIFGESFASLGITPDTSFVWTIGSGDTVTVEFSSIPEPLTAAALIGLSALGFAIIRRRRCAQPRSMRQRS